ncbi:MAG: hypothetical protein ACI9J3_003820 [Parvicellaceae bacterium]|jgi:uncharacterized protein with HEPN domain
MSHSDLDYLRHILKEVDYVLSHTVGMQEDAFLSDETMTRAVVRSLEIIGEASKKVDVGFREKYSRRKWQECEIS